MRAKIRYVTRGMPTSDAVRVIEIDDVIPKLYQDQIETEASADTMAWFFNRESGRRVDVGTSYGGFSHVAYRFNNETASSLSPLTALLLPLLYTFCDKAGVPFKQLLRIRLGMFTQNAAGGPYHNAHVDFYLPHYNALYYVNDSDGDTFVFNETYDQVSLERSVEYTRDAQVHDRASDLAQEGTNDRFRRQALPREHAPRSRARTGSRSPSASFRPRNVRLRNQ